MKKLYLSRHAKSSWKDSGLNDFERPLNNRGRRDAPFMGRLLKEKGIKPELIVSSSALRAYSTAESFAWEINYPPDKIVKEDNLYAAGFSEIIKVIAGIRDSVKSLMIIAHNPGLTDLYNFLCNKRIDNIPTSGIVSLTLNVKHWNQVDENTCKLEFFEYPKKYIK